MKVFDLIDNTLYNEMVAAGYINVTKHPQFDLWILNYSAECQIAKAWNVASETCRGLIVDADMNIVARPFRKFYNYEEHVANGTTDVIPVNMSFEIYEKMDGSLGILYWGPDGKPYISTRGSFASDQAIHASNLLQTKYADKLHLLDKSKTYLFEIIYPDDLHVVTYKGVDDIFLLAVINTATGEEDNIDEWSHIFNCTKRYDGVTDYLKIRELFKYDGGEGFVVKFANNFRMKLKYAEYWKLHFLKAGFTEKAIFGYIASDDIEAIETAMSMFDEEHVVYYNSIIDKIMNAYNEVREIVSREYKDFPSKKDAAIYFKSCTYPHLMFMVYDNVSHERFNEAIWNVVDMNLYNHHWQLKTYLENKAKKFYNEDETPFLD